MAVAAVEALHSGITEGKVVMQIPDHVPKLDKDMSRKEKSLTPQRNTSKQLGQRRGKQLEQKQIDIVSLTAQIQKTIEQAVTDTVGQSIDMESPLMEAGVDSLASSDLISKINDDMGVSLAPTILFDHPTIQDLTEHLVHMLKGPESEGAVEDLLVKPSNRISCMVVVLHGIGSSGEYLGKGIAKFLPPNVKVVGLDRPGLGSWSDSEPVESMAAVLDHMLSILPDLNVPTILLGYSYG